MISKLISYSENLCHEADTSDDTLSRTLFELLKAWVVITLEEFDPFEQGKPYGGPPLSFEYWPHY